MIACRTSLVLALVALSGSVLMAQAGESTFLRLQEMLNGGIINKPELAVGISELIIANAYGREELVLQRPLSATDLDNQWLIEGNTNRTQISDGRGPIRILMRKTDAAILDVRLPLIMSTSPNSTDIQSTD